MRRHSFFLRLFHGNLLIVVVVVAVAAAVSYHFLNPHYLATANAYQDHLLRIVQQHLEDVWPLPPERVDRLCKHFLHGAEPVPASAEAALGAAATARLTVIARDGVVLGDSQSNPADMENHRTPDRPEVMAALDGRPGLDRRRSETLGVEFRYVARPIRHQGRLVGTVRVAMPIVAMLENQSLIRDAVFWGSIVGIATFAILGLFINWIWYAPLRQITETARQIASGNLAERARVSGSVELAELASALNAMRDSLAEQIETISTARENLEQVVANLKEGVIATDDQGRIILMNQAALQLLAHDGTDVVGRHIQEAVRVADIVRAHADVMASGRPVSRQVDPQIGGRRRYLAIRASSLASGPQRSLGALVVVRDVTDLVQTAAMKAEFVANASHELRTPLATLRAAVDSLNDLDPDDREAVAKACTILDRHVRRLEELTLDLLDLHAVEDSSRAIAADTIPFGSVADWAREHYAEAAGEKGLTLEFDVEAPDEVFVSDRRLLELILQNLIDNALKFTPSGGRISCSLRRRDGGVLFRVADTGCGIRPEDRPRIFERFYQADTARSGVTEARGTGLGLAIVKHAAERLGAGVSIQSDFGKGTTVTVVVPDRAAERAE